MPESAAQTRHLSLGIESGEAFIKDREIGLLKKGARKENPALLTMRQLPSRLANRLH